MNVRIKYLITFLILLFVEVFIALFIHDNFIRPYVGDILVVIVIYMAVRIIFPYKFENLAIYTFLFAVFVELLQLINIVKILGLENNKFLSTLIGSTFDLKDIACYAIGTIILIIFRKKLN